MMGRRDCGWIGMGLGKMPYLLLRVHGSKSAGVAGLAALGCNLADLLLYEHLVSSKASKGK